MDLLTFALIMSTHWLRLYFQEHPIRVLTEAHLKKILLLLDVSGRLMNYAVELSEFDIEHVPRNIVKGQVLEDFITEFTGFPEEIRDVPPRKPW